MSVCMRIHMEYNTCVYLEHDGDSDDTGWMVALGRYQLDVFKMSTRTHMCAFKEIDVVRSFDCCAIITQLSLLEFLTEDTRNALSHNMHATQFDAEQ